MSKGCCASDGESVCSSRRLLSSLLCSDSDNSHGVRYLTMVAAAIKRPPASCSMVLSSGLSTKFGNLLSKYRVISSPTHSIGTSCRRQTTLDEKVLHRSST